MKEWNEGNSPKKLYDLSSSPLNKRYHYGFAFEILFWATFFLGG